MADFSNYELGQNPYHLAYGVLSEIAEAAQFPLTAPSEEELSALIARIGPDKELQKNIGLVKESLGDDASVMADWVEQSGVLTPVNRPFVAPGEVPKQIDAVVFTGGVANWILRRTALAERIDPDTVGRVVIPVGNRQMGEAEHQLVKTYSRTEGDRPTERAFAERFVVPRLALAGFDVRVVAVDDGNGDKVLDAAFAEVPELLNGTVLTVSNAPNTIQAAGQLRLAAQRADTGFDADGNQLYMVSDTIPVARRGEGTATHQNPETALGQIARNALFLVKNYA